MNTCPKCGMVKGLHGSVLPGCTCWDAYPQHAETDPQQRPWVGLSNGEMIELSEMQLGNWDLILEVEAKLKDKNT